MPIITIDTPYLNKAQKQELTANLTKAASSIIQLPEQAFIVVIREVDNDNVGVGGILLSDRA
ncbi:4-oxalocrotonate tautomerase [bacterium BFN5]|nr:4-oxalocrotonate tautomerase [bacterium BFN5]